MDKNYAIIKLPETLMVPIDKLVLKKTLGFRNRTEFVTDAVRKSLKEIDGGSS